jgi:hypothetical protein
VTDADGQAAGTASFDVGAWIRWANLVEVTYDEATTTLTKTGRIGWAAGAGSYDALPDGADGQIAFSVPELTGHRYFVGLSDVDESPHYSTIDHAIYYYGGAVYVYEDGAFAGAHSTARPGDVFTIRREGAAIRYYQNRKLLRETAATAGALIVDVSMYETGAQAHDFQASFCRGD